MARTIEMTEIKRLIIELIMEKVSLINHGVKLYALSEFVKHGLNSSIISIVTSLNTLNVLKGNIEKITGVNTEPITINDLKKWDIDEELKRLNIITE